jgi:hypothetical protein
LQSDRLAADAVLLREIVGFLGGEGTGKLFAHSLSGMLRVGACVKLCGDMPRVNPVGRRSLSFF